MNADRRKQISKIIISLSEIRSEIEELQSEEQDYFDNMPENMQSGENGCAAEQSAQLLDDAMNSIDDVMSNLETALE